MSKEIIIYCDESNISGRYFSNFYGGALVDSKNLDEVNTLLLQKKCELNLHGEIKWSKITENYLNKYINFVELLFGLITTGKLKIRIMFTQNRHIPQNLSDYHIEHEYFLLYYQFIKHAFGLQNLQKEQQNTNVRLYFDKFPDTKEKAMLFKSSLLHLNHNKKIKNNGVIFLPENITDVHSHDHVILQSVDIILGAMQFRLNDHHKDKPEGQRCRGKRTIAKETVYKYINAKVREIYPGFNIGASTSHRGDPMNRWTDPYRHWLFIPADSNLDNQRTKKNKK
ncbi:TPA: DUF3800 domain-containing protein [Legionella pneumophila]|uniref:DUF3800 domain-containing protein n=1 Tax=Legionella pneumophila TaxID=446 RepID=UPI001374C7B0|nr:DUF3800 domain-containing protein [Legionella pneumophila]HAT9703079.1 DUF3800 domain-containing protein [Legionella pneumophila subsp. pneumophila]MDI0469828.1 DUF3800 domain-containing protein [Legionella pneumophila]HAT8742748.1 DUF3800 domain-containing protein [Legionella pneumophila]HAU1444114.1 DUF3800 domain-containing protein [Legionella pneumophila]HBI2978865.1 DUF3800 domain-containing protein [Legionella pneumophila]